MTEVPEEAVEAALDSLMDKRVEGPAEGEELNVVRQDVREALEAAAPAIRSQERERVLSDDAIRRGAVAALPEAFPSPEEQNDPGAWCDEDVEWAENIVRTAFLAALDTQEDSDA
jgi:hypothetical protein